SCWCLSIVVIAFIAMSSLSSYFSVISPLAHQREKKIINVKKDSSLPAKASACHHVSVLAQECKINVTFHLPVWKM
ncbi:unnamed protein product, partial [Bubo scandiacus]